MELRYKNGVDCPGSLVCYEQSWLVIFRTHEHFYACKWQGFFLTDDLLFCRAGISGICLRAAFSAVFPPW